MSEIRTCEEFVVNELLEIREKLAEKEEYITVTTNKLGALIKKQEMVKKHIKAELNSSNYRDMKYISFSGTLWEDDEDYNKILEILKEQGYDFAKENEGKTE